MINNSNYRAAALLGVLASACLMSAGACSGGKPENAGKACGGAGTEVDAAKVTEPVNWKPNASRLSDSELLAKGRELWEDKSLSKAGNTSCQSCHGSATAMFKESFANPYPHEVEMAKQKSGKKTVTAAEMVQFCMAVPMAAQPLAWDDVRLAALARAVEDARMKYGEATGK